jgi:hypothetical protein
MDDERVAVASGGGIGIVRDVAADGAARARYEVAMLAATWPAGPPPFPPHGLGLLVRPAGSDDVAGMFWRIGLEGSAASIRADEACGDPGPGATPRIGARFLRQGYMWSVDIELVVPAAALDARCGRAEPVGDVAAERAQEDAEALEALGGIVRRYAPPGTRGLFEDGPDRHRR